MRGRTWQRKRSDLHTRTAPRAGTSTGRGTSAPSRAPVRCGASRTTARHLTVLDRLEKRPPTFLLIPFLWLATREHSPIPLHIPSHLLEYPHWHSMTSLFHPNSQGAGWSKIGDGSVTVTVHHDGPPTSEPTFKLDISAGELSCISQDLTSNQQEFARRSGARGVWRVACGVWCILSLLS